MEKKREQTFGQPKGDPLGDLFVIGIPVIKLN